MLLQLSGCSSKEEAQPVLGVVLDVDEQQTGHSMIVFDVVCDHPCILEVLIDDKEVFSKPLLTNTQRLLFPGIAPGDHTLDIKARSEIDTSITNELQYTWTATDVPAYQFESIEMWWESAKLSIFTACGREGETKNIYCWGTNYSLNDLLPTVERISEPVQLVGVTALFPGLAGTCMMTISNELFCFGSDGDFMKSDFGDEVQLSESGQPLVDLFFRRLCCSDVRNCEMH